MKNESSNTNTCPKKSLSLIKQIKSILINFNKTKFINKYKLNDEPVFNKLLESTNNTTNLDNSDNSNNTDNLDNSNNTDNLDNSNNTDNLDNLDNSDNSDIFGIFSKT